MKSIIIIGLIFSSQLQASPTKNEFISCQKISVKLLERCLDMSTDYKDTSCWEWSKNSYNSCYEKVMFSHDKKAMAKRKAEKKRREAVIKAKEKK